MANHKSARKRARQDVKKAHRSRHIRSAVRTLEKSLKQAIGEKRTDAARELLKTFMSKISKATKKGIYKKNNSARKISRLSHQIDKISK